MHSNYPCSLWYVLECCCHCTFFEVQFLVIAILVWTCLTVFFLGASSQYYIVTSCICSCFVCYFNSRSAYFNVCDNWSVRCDCGYNEWICVRPVAEYFLTVLVTFPSVAVCVVCSLLYIFKCSRGLNLILVYRSVIFVCDAVTPDAPVITNVKVSGSTIKVTYKAAANATGYDVVDPLTVTFVITGASGVIADTTNGYAPDQSLNTFLPFSSRFQAWQYA